MIIEMKKDANSLMAEHVVRFLTQLGLVHIYVKRSSEGKFVIAACANGADVDRLILSELPGVSRVRVKDLPVAEYPKFCEAYRFSFNKKEEVSA